MPPSDRYFFVVSGETGTLPLAELRATLQSTSRLSSFETPSERIAVVSGDIDLPSTIARSAYAISGSRLIATLEFDKWEAEVNDVPFENYVRGSDTFAVQAKSLQGRGLSEKLKTLIGSVVKKRVPSAQVYLQNPKQTVIAVVGDGRIYLGITEFRSLEKHWSERRPRARPFFHASALFPKFARALVNLTRVRAGETLLDPFCGTGSIVLEAELMGITTVAVDLARRMCLGTLMNMGHFAASTLGVIHADSAFLPIRTVHAIATDIPYGRSASTRGRSSRELLGKTMDWAGERLETGRYCCLVHPSTLEFNIPDGLEVEETHQIYIHRTLTRVVTVLRAR